MIVQGNNVDVIQTLRDQCVDSVVTDPPYGLSKEPDMVEVMRQWLAGDDYTHTGGGFMGKTWDSFVPGPSIWREVYRVLKPGGHMLVFSGTRTYDLTVLAIRLAGFQIRDQLAWIYGTGFPKSTNLGGGWGTALKPAHEPIVLARKPPVGTATKNALEHGTGGINIDGCRVDGARRGPNVLIDPLVAAVFGERARFFYCAKASKAEREAGLASLPIATPGEITGRKDGTAGLNNPRAGAGRTSGRRNTHPTVKPVSLMRWLTRLITPRGGVVLDPYAGSGTTEVACILEGFKCLGIELESPYVEIAKRRVANVFTNPGDYL